MRYSRSQGAVVVLLSASLSSKFTSTSMAVLQSKACLWLAWTALSSPCGAQAVVCVVTCSGDQTLLALWLECVVAVECIPGLKARARLIAHC